MGACSGGRILPLVAVLALALAGCASGPQYVASGHHAHRSPGEPVYQIEPYQVKGVWYYPRPDYNYDETGTASWYGPGFDKRLTSDNEIYDMNQLSAAHKTLPLPSMVQVTNLQNGRSIRLRVNDRGPFVDGRIIDLSRRAAQLLGFEGIGTAPVRVRILKEESIQVAEAAMHGGLGAVAVAQAAPVTRTEPNPAPQVAAAGPPSLRAAETIGTSPPVAVPPAAASQPEPRPAPAMAQGYWPTLIPQAHAETLHPSIAPTLQPARKPAPVAAGNTGRMFIQAGAFAVPENAQRVRTRIATLGSVEIVKTAANGRDLYQVRVGPVASEAAAARLLSRVVESGYPGARVVGQ
jgi:rare lipoprotein A